MNDEHEPGAPGTLTDVIVDELRERAARAERRVARLEMAIVRAGAFDPGLRDHILEEAAKIDAEEIESFLAKARAM